MDANVSQQGMVFVYCILSGVAIGLVFDFLRIIRRMSRAGPVLTQFLDVVFWASAILLFSFCVFTFNDGDIRWFEFFAMAAGAGAHFILISPWLVKASIIALSFLGNILKFVLKILLFPIGIILKVLQKTCIFVFSPIKGVANILKKLLKNNFYKIFKSFKRFKLRLKKV